MFERAQRARVPTGEQAKPGEANVVRRPGGTSISQVRRPGSEAELLLERPPTTAQARREAPALDPAEAQADEVGERIGKDIGSIPMGAGPLPEAARLVAESHLGVELNGTVLREDGAAQDRASDLDSLAVTEGKRISFAKGQLSAGSVDSPALVGHELTHVAQQRVHGPSAPQGQRAGGRSSRAPSFSVGQLVVTKIRVDLMSEIGGEPNRTLVARLPRGTLLRLDSEHPRGGGRVFFATVMISPSEADPARSGVVSTAWVRKADVQPPAKPEPSESAENEAERSPSGETLMEFEFEDGLAVHTAVQARADYIDNLADAVGVGLTTGGYVIYLRGLEKPVFVSNDMIRPELSEGSPRDETVHADRDTAQASAATRGDPFAYYHTLNRIIAPTTFSPASTPRILKMATAAFQELGRLGSQVFTQMAIAMVGGRAVAAVIGRIFRWASGAGARTGPTPGNISLKAILGEKAYAEHEVAAIMLRASSAQLRALTVDEVIAIRIWSNQAFGKMNLALRSGNPPGMALYTEINQLVLSGLKKLPGYSGRVIRSESLAVSDALSIYRQGETFRPSGFMATTRGKGVESREGNVFITITAKGSAGKDISQMAVHGEGEVLFPPGTPFRVDLVKQHGIAIEVKLTEL